ncbi:hypothetical protein H0H92_010120 [Tricholoma furcatifolium]|nr:hypothetical protein H0H92_010120 [Tricholoma furcatifolium]
MPTLTDGQVFKVFVVATAGAVTLNTSDGTTIQSERDENANNQLWLAQQDKSDSTNRSWALKSLWQNKGNDVFLGFSNQSAGSPLLGVSTAQVFYIDQSNNVGGSLYQIWLPNDSGVLADLRGGSTIEPDVIQLWSVNNSASQFFMFQWIPNPPPA